MKVSIITAVYNGAASIAATLQSVACQDYPGIEHIVVDGASSDATLATIGLHDQRLARLISEPDRGVYDAFNKGLRAATGDVIAFLNCGDTYLDTSSVATLAGALAQNDADAAFADVSIVDSGEASREVRRYSSRRFRPSRMRMGLMPAHPTLFLRREIYQAVGEYDTQFRIAGDFELCLRVFARRATRYHYVEAPLVRMPRGGLSNSGWRSKLEITREMRRACAKNGIATNFATLCLRFPLKILEMV
jgi:glycosyltransferase involved in cell wall biosynthesis